MKVLTNFLLFQAGWFATVLGAAQGAPWIGPVVVLAVVAIHLRTAHRPQAEARLVASAVALGLVADSLLLATGWIAYPNGGWIPGMAPYWIISLSALFATTLNVSMQWLRGRALLAALFGAVGGPLSYLAGARLGAMSFVDTTAAIAALAVIWALVMPLLMKLATRFDSTGRRAHPAYILDEWRQVDSHG